MKKWTFLFFLCFISSWALAEKQISSQQIEDVAQEVNAARVGSWTVQCQLQKFPEAVSAERYGNGYRIPVYICSATQKVPLIDSTHNLNLIVKITPFYIMLKLNGTVVDNRYTTLFVGDHEPWHLYANCYDIPNDQSCVFLLGDQQDLSKVRRALLGEKDFMVQMTEKNTEQAIHFIFPLAGYSQIYSAMQESANAVHSAYVNLHQNPNFD